MYPFNVPGWSQFNTTHLEPRYNVQNHRFTSFHNCIPLYSPSPTPSTMCTDWSDFIPSHNITPNTPRTDRTNNTRITSTYHEAAAYPLPSHHITSHRSASNFFCADRSDNHVGRLVRTLASRQPTNHKEHIAQNHRRTGLNPRKLTTPRSHHITQKPYSILQIGPKCNPLQIGLTRPTEPASLRSQRHLPHVSSRKRL